MKSIFSHTNQGKRNSNQDAIFPLDNQTSKIFIVCDGVGGSYRGEMASQTIANSMGMYLSQIEAITEEDITESLLIAEQGLVKVILEENIQGTKTTLAMVALNENKAIVAHCGDSEVYHIRNGSVLFKTQNHTYVQFLLDRKMITEEESKNHPQKHAITRYIDGINAAQLDFSELELLDDDILIVCSDGITEGADINSLCRKYLKAEDLYNSILLECQQNSCDNFSLILVSV